MERLSMQVIYYMYVCNSVVVADIAPLELSNVRLRPITHKLKTLLLVLCWIELNGSVDQQFNIGPLNHRKILR